MTDNVHTCSDQTASKAESSAPFKSWRDVLNIHPAADLFPLMGPDELKALGIDIDKNGMKSPIVLWCKGECSLRRGRRSPYDANPEDIFLLDGRNRLDALETIGLRVEVHYKRVQNICL